MENSFTKWSEKYAHNNTPTVGPDHMIAQIMDHFDWDKVHKAMLAMEWNWHLGIGSIGNIPCRGIPDRHTIKAHAKAQLEMLMRKKQP